jgi:hypothetical protein
MRLDSSGNLGIGTTSPGSFAGTVKLVVGSAATTTTPGAVTVYSGNATYGGLYFADGTVGDQLYRGAVEYNHSTDALLMYSAGLERARIDSSGNLLVGVTTAAAQGGLTIYPTGSAGGPLVVWNRPTTASTTTATDFRNASTSVGSITYTNTATAYNTSSDYRLKEFVAPVTNAGERIDALNPVEFDWKSDGSRARGFFAHEFQQVYANSVTGEKDAVDEDGKPVYQAMQASTAEVIADLVAEIKSLRVRLNALENK